MKTRSVLFALAAAILANLSLHARCVLAHGFPELVGESGTVTHTAQASGSWSAATTWDTGIVPGNGAVAKIPAGFTVTVTNVQTAAVRTVIVAVGGTLRFKVDANTQLRVENLLVAGSLNVGTDADPIQAPYTAKIVFHAPTAQPTDSARMGRGLVADHTAIIRMNGAGARTPFVALANSVGPNIGQQFSTVGAPPTDWEIGDTLVLPTTMFTREWSETMPAYGTSMLRNEVRTLDGKNATSITIDSPLAYQHLRAENLPSIRVHVANLTRNVILESENTDIGRRGHVMIMTNNARITGVLFNRLGRTDKRSVVSDPTLAANPYNPTPFANPRGRYALHFHMAGTELGGTAALVTKSVVRDTPGWGFVNHASNVNFTDNVCFDFDGAGFVAEDGNERGSFSGNIAIGGIGNGEFPNQRTVFGNHPRFDQGDMGFQGEGFWFQGPDVTVTNNIAAGCKGSGFFYWAAGRFDPLNPFIPLTGHYTGTPLAQVPAGVEPKKWDYGQNGTFDAAIISSIPVRQFSGNTAYACFTGLRMRFVYHPNLTIFSDVRNLHLEDEVRTLQYDGNETYTISDSTFWNNLNGIHGSYVRNGAFENIMIVADPAYLPNGGPRRQEAGLGVDFHFQNSGCTLNNVTVKNYITGVWRETVTTNPVTFNVAVTGVTFSNCDETVYNDGTTNAHGFTDLGQTCCSNDIPDYLE